MRRVLSANTALCQGFRFYAFGIHTRVLRNFALHRPPAFELPQFDAGVLRHLGLPWKLCEVPLSDLYLKGLRAR